MASPWVVRICVFESVALFIGLVTGPLTLCISFSFHKTCNVILVPSLSFVENLNQIHSSRTGRENSCTLTDSMMLSNDKAVPDKFNLHSQLHPRSLFANQCIRESVGFGPLLCAWNDCVNVLLMLKIV